VCFDFHSCLFSAVTFRNVDTQFDIFGNIQNKLNGAIHDAFRPSLTAVGPFKFPAPKSGTLSQIPSGTRPSMHTVLDVCSKRTSSLYTSAFSALEVLDDNCVP